MKLRRPSPGTTLGTIAIAISLTGTGYALTITSSDIKDGSVQSRDIADGGVRGRDIKPGTIEVSDLSSTAIAALRGAKGDKGDTGSFSSLQGVPCSRDDMSGDTVVTHHADGVAELYCQINWMPDQWEPNNSADAASHATLAIDGDTGPCTKARSVTYEYATISPAEDTDWYSYSIEPILPSVECAAEPGYERDVSVTLTSQSGRAAIEVFDNGSRLAPDPGAGPGILGYYTSTAGSHTLTFKVASPVRERYTLTITAVVFDGDTLS